MWGTLDLDQSRVSHALDREDKTKTRQNSHVPVGFGAGGGGGGTEMVVVMVVVDVATKGVGTVRKVVVTVAT